MDRFIGTIYIILLNLTNNLKSNMDRFIALRAHSLTISDRFKIQYG